MYGGESIHLKKEDNNGNIYKGVGKYNGSQKLFRLLQQLGNKASLFRCFVIYFIEILRG